jgi:hypothetical protein
MSEWVAVIGRFTPIGSPQPFYDAVDKRERQGGCFITVTGEPRCQTVKLERIVREEESKETDQTTDSLRDSSS